MENNEAKIKINEVVRRRISRLSKAEDERLRCEYFDKLNAEYKKFKEEDPQGWKQYQEELALWDCTLMDGLEDEPPYPLTDDSSSGQTAQ